jgi:hypothetical protein
MAKGGGPKIATQIALPNLRKGSILEAFVNNRKEVIQCLIVYRRGRRHS